MDRLNNSIIHVSAGLLFAGALCVAKYYQDKRNNNINEGYISTTRVDLRLEDINRDGKLESIIKIDSIDYLLMEKENKPLICKYDVIINKDSIVIEK